LPEEASPSTFDVGSGSEVRDLADRLRQLDRPDQRNRFSDEASEHARTVADRTRDKLHVVADEAHERLNELADRAHTIAHEAEHRLRELRGRFNERLPEWKRQARERAQDARVVARRTAVQIDEQAKKHPVETIAAAAGVGFVLGATMRIWRSSRG
jgi:ElaB/YqjD/DUF883 family membrane-anchored ribosome-binding protein